MADLPSAIYAIALVVALAQLLVPSAADTPVSIASPSVCFSVHDCPKTQFCKAVDRKFPPHDDSSTEDGFTCAQRLDAGTSCNPRDAFACKQGLHCPSGAKAPKCTRLPGAGAKCDPRKATACADGLLCTSGGVCTKRSATGGVDTPCVSDHNCRIENMLACSPEAKKCAARRAFGKHCSPPNSYDPDEPARIRSGDCVGYCKPLAKDTIDGTCDWRRGVGQACTSDAMCWNVRQVPAYWENPRRCNHGKCVPEQNLRKRLGDPCTRGMDACDERRALKCLWSVAQERTVCQQRGDFEQRGTAEEFCTPGSPFSTCVGPGSDGRPLECRERRDDKGFVSAIPSDSRYFQCLQRSQPVELGGPCTYDIDRCPDGSFCREVPYFLFSDRPRISSYRHWACMELLSVGGDCTKDKLTSMCGDGLKCGAAGKCVKGEEGSNQTYIRGGIYSECGPRSYFKLSCPKGLYCDEDSGFGYGICEEVVSEVGLGESCGTKLRRTCSKGLWCSEKNIVHKCITSK